MSRPIRITAIPNEEPDIRLYVLALIALARQLQEEEQTEPPQPAQDQAQTSDREAGDG